MDLLFKEDMRTVPGSKIFFVRNLFLEKVG